MSRVRILMNSECIGCLSSDWKISFFRWIPGSLSLSDWSESINVMKTLRIFQNRVAAVHRSDIRLVYRRLGLGLMGWFLAIHLPAQDQLRSIPDADPSYQLSTLYPAEGFEVNLFASEPMVVKPIQMNWD